MESVDYLSILKHRSKAFPNQFLITPFTSPSNSTLSIRWSIETKARVCTQQTTAKATTATIKAV